MTNNLNTLLPYNHKLDARSISDIQLLVIHCTELPDIQTARTYGEKVHYDSGTGNSGHYYISKQGASYQWVENNRVAHHVKDHNSNSIGIELDNLGRYPHWHFSNQQIMNDKYPTAQIESLVRLILKLQQQIPTLKYITGHEDLDTRLIKSENDPKVYIRRKMDPGKLFPWEAVMQQIKLINIGSLGTQVAKKPGKQK
ncbi:MAG: N-acetylmuramoyl-L-alanine amidase [Alcanivoracaceae bacterium]|nr:N-acetylmuramoyl-L-alanine amidase [Alcanivoracaceae bacterium]